MKKLSVFRWDVPGTQVRTRLWYSKAVKKAIGDLDGSEQKSLRKRLIRYMKHGFRHYERDDFPICSESNGIWRIGHRNDLFRIIGFYENNTDQNFIATHAFKKKGQELTSAQQEMLRQARQIREQASYQKETRDG